MVQYRDKTSETAELVRIGTALHEVTRKANVPLLINDRVDVALAVGAEGVHIGQDDMGMWGSFESRLQDVDHALQILPWRGSCWGRMPSLV